jgi:hypothetical protein
MPESKAPTFRTVHFDHVDPEKRQQFENARRQWLRALNDAGLSDERGLFIQAGASTFLTLHTVGSFAELDRLQKARRVAPTRLKAAVDVYDRDSDSALVPPHHSELWSWADYLDYRPGDGALDERTFVTGYMLVEEVYPGPRGDPYYDAWEEVRAALEKARYPLTRLTFSTSYGRGRTISLWLAKSRAELESTPSLADTIARVLGKEKAETLLERQRSAVVSTEKFDIVRRRDLDSPERVSSAGKD